jgi:hypothetical protein
VPGATTLITPMHVRLTAITGQAGSLEAYLSARARGMAGTGIRTGAIAAFTPIAAGAIVRAGDIAADLGDADPITAVAHTSTVVDSAVEQVWLRIPGLAAGRTWAALPVVVSTEGVEVSTVAAVTADF